MLRWSEWREARAGIGVLALKGTFVGIIRLRTVCEMVADVVLTHGPVRWHHIREIRNVFCRLSKERCSRAQRKSASAQLSQDLMPRNRRRFKGLQERAVGRAIGVVASTCVMISKRR